MNNDKKIREDLLESIAEGSLVPQGTVTVEIRDERGKVKDRETKDNFISKAWKLHARAVLRTRWLKFGYNPSFTGQYNETTFGALWSGRHSTPALPNDFIAAWNQTTAEDAVNEESPVIPATGLIAWASRHPFGSPTGARGNVNSTESNLTDFRARFVFDWLTSQGNGTFQSVGWMAMNGPGLPHMHFGKGFRRRFQTAAIPSLTTYIAGTTIGYLAGGGWIDSSNGKYYFPVVRYNQFRGQFRILSVDMSGLNDSNDNGLGTAADVTGMTISLESDEFTPTSALTTIQSPSGDRIIGRDGTNTIFVYATNTETASNGWRWGKVAATGASTTYASSGSKMGWASGCVLGGFAYIGNSYEDSNIQKYDISTGTLSATLTLDAAAIALCTLNGLTLPRIEDMVTDGTDIYVLVNQRQSQSSLRALMFRINTSGVTQEFLGSPGNYVSSSSPTESVAAPYNTGNGIFSYSASQLFQPSNEVFMGGLLANVTDDAKYGPYDTRDALLMPVQRFVSCAYMHLAWYDGALHLISNVGSFSANRDGAFGLMFMWHGYRRGMDLGSRVLLATSKTKLNTETMKITYDVTLPGWTS